MEIRVVAVERTENGQIYSASGIMLGCKYILVTSNIFTTHPDLKSYLHIPNPGNLLLPSGFNSDNLQIIYKNSNDEFSLKKAFILAVFVSEKLQRSTNQLNATGMKNLSIFFVLKTESSGDIADFREHLVRWWHLVRGDQVVRGDEILIESAAFGNKFFLDSWNRGIVSNFVGEESCLVVGDCSATPGSEGSPVYKTNSNCRSPFGMVVSSSWWCRGDWTGLTLIADLRPILAELLCCQYQNNSPNTSTTILEVVDKCLVRVSCRSKWGTGVILNLDQGILLTNSHVIDEEHQINISWNKHQTEATIIFKTPDFEHFDLAILRCDLSAFKTNLKSIEFFETSVSAGDEVFAAGFSLFSSENSQRASVSRGCVAQSSESMITTTCCVNSGMSGGPVLNKLGQVVGIIVCNTRCNERVFPKFNMAVPFFAIASTFREFLESRDSRVLDKLHLKFSPKLQPWKRITAKL